ncbi:D-alanyl-D-alanine dipeptidase [Pseudoxanthomonas indica]|nr:D-alanyl-D-alanine dipeptidase [Pseudoxanthomonas indica]
MGWACALLLSASVQAAEVKVSPATRLAEVDLVDVGALIADAQLEIRYAGSHNFVGTPVTGYEAPKCYLLRPVAEALVQVAADVREQGYRLRLFDCYRPVRAVQHFVRWAHDLDDQRNKAEFYPNLDKSVLLDGYIAETSGHSRGATVDLSLDHCTADACAELDMGTSFDRFDTLANTDDPRIQQAAREHRDLLRAAMQRRGFRNYPLEWWHFTFQPEPTPQTAYDIPVR